MGIEGLNRVRVDSHHWLPELFAAEDRMCWFLYLPYLHLTGMREGYAILEEQFEGATILYRMSERKGRPVLEIHTPPMPYSTAAMDHAVERVRDTNRRSTVRVRYVEEAQMPDLARAGFRIHAREREFYYDCAQVVPLDGSQFKKLRKEINKAANLPGFVARDYTAEDEAGCMEVLDRWRSRLKEAGLPAEGYRLTANCLAEAPDWPQDLIKGRVAEIDGTIHGFSFAGPISPDCGNLMIGISDTEFRGLSYFLRHDQMAEWTSLPAFNDGHDAGRGGLSDLKRSFRPPRMVQIFRAQLT
ncbi:phosphatidylglycerol lysyltransferase domain-containing protein [Paracoccaceae bacterium GXU_MW_L88]